MWRGDHTAGVYGFRWTYNGVCGLSGGRTERELALQTKRKRWIRLAAAAAGLLLFLVFYIDDWGRDFTTNEAFVTPQSTDPGLRALRSERPLEEMVLAIRGAGRRIRNWKYIGEARDEAAVSLLFERTARVLRFTDDITIRVEDRGDHRLVTGVSKSRMGYGDLGRNPKNLRRLLSELEDVLDGAGSLPRGGP